MAIRTSSADSTFSTVASTVVPGRSTSSGVTTATALTSWAGSTGRTGVTDIAMRDIPFRQAS